jgi:ATP-dependent Lon protease
MKKVSMDYDILKQVERELIFVLKEEYSFYQSLYIIFDKQRDLIKYNSDEHLLDLFAEIERNRLRIKKSEEKVAALKDRHPQAFQMAAVLPEVKKIVNSIATLVKKNLSLVSECESYLKERCERIKSELGELKNSEKILQYLRNADPSPQFVDGKQ